MTPEALTAAASLLYGNRWQRSLSLALKVDYRLVRRWARGYRPIPLWVEPILISLLQQRLEDIETKIEELISSQKVTCLHVKCKTSADSDFPS